jgi:predicted AAA+ superfamily ATPase
MAYNYGQDSINGVQLWIRLQKEVFMLSRLLQLSKTYSFFLFGARGTGKTSLLREIFEDAHTFWIDLLDPDQEAYFARDPNALKDIVKSLPAEKTHIVIDEVQKSPKLLDVIHQLIEQPKQNKYFIMTGSSARKLKQGAANLLAGRAFVYHLYPFSFIEVKDKFNLNQSLQFGLLPKLFDFQSTEDQHKFLQSYAHTYLKEEIVTEQLVKKLDPFRRFLEVAGQMNGKIISYHKIAQDVGVDDKTVQNYYQILEDTLLGFYLEPFHTSLRKRLSQKPKFFFFDLGVVHAVTRTLSLNILPQTSYYGEVFEQFIIVEIFKLCQYFKSEYRLTYLQTKDNFEIDLVVERPGLPLLLVEIKSATQIQDNMLTNLKKIKKDFPEAATICLSQDIYAKEADGIRMLPWQQGIIEYFTS